MDNTKNYIWKIGALAGIMLSLLLLILSIKEARSISYVGRDTPILNVITVNGTGDAVAIPDIATFSFSVTETAKLITDAQTKATDKINSALKSLKDAGILDKDIKTTSYSINPHYEYTSGVCGGGVCTSGKSVLTGYDVSQSIEVKVRDLKKAGSIFETIGSLGVQNVNGLTFSIDDSDSVKAEARAKAIENAQAKAKTLARTLGVKLVRITSFYDSSDEPVPYPYAEGMGGAMSLKATDAARAPEIPSGEKKITSKVSITYEIR